MKKLLFVFVALCIVLSGCSKKEPANATWDHEEFKSLEELNKKANTNIKDVDLEKTDESFILIANSIAQYKFKTNDEDWCIRASSDVDNDISGLHYDSIGFEKDMTSTYYTDEVYAYRFFFEDNQYVVFLDVKDKDISTSYFDSICNEFKTSVTGVKSGYENTLFEDGDDVVYEVTIFNDDGSTMIMDSIYSFKGDKMEKITSKVTFETEEAMNNYLNDLKEYGNSIDDIVIDGTTISSDNSKNVDFYSDYTKEAFINMMKDSISN